MRDEIEKSQGIFQNFKFQARDCSFERLLLSCTSDDQKAVKSRLMQMKDFVDRTT